MLKPDCEMAPVLPSRESSSPLAMLTPLFAFSSFPAKLLPNCFSALPSRDFCWS